MDPDPSRAAGREPVTRAGLTEHEIPEGAALLAVADAWDVMTSGRPYSEAEERSTRRVAECARLVGTQFTSVAVGALLKLHARGELDPTIQAPGGAWASTPGRRSSPAETADRLRTASDAHYPRG